MIQCWIANCRKILVSRKGETKYDKSKKKQYKIEKVSVLILFLFIC